MSKLSEDETEDEDEDEDEAEDETELSIVTAESRPLSGLLGSLGLEGFLEGEVVDSPIVR